MFKKSLKFLGGLVISSVCAHAFALENGADSAALGAEGIMAGNLPPEGLYLLTYYQNYHATEMVDHHGNSAIPDFGLDTNALVARMVWMTDKNFLGGQLGFYGVQPFVNLRLSAGGFSDSNKGLGDFVFAPLLAWHDRSHNWAIALESVVPTGEYDKKNGKPIIANIGKNYYTIRPVFAYSYIQPDGWDISTKASYSVNTKNEDTDYKSGDYIALDYNVGYKVSPVLTVGMSGYALKQLSSDKLESVAVDNKAQVIAYGPTIAYHPSKQWFIESKYLFEDQVENKSKGTAAWLKFVWAF